MEVRAVSGAQQYTVIQPVSGKHSKVIMIIDYRAFVGVLGDMKESYPKY